jgi:hypothetical protein
MREIDKILGNRFKLVIIRNLGIAIEQVINYVLYGGLSHYFLCDCLFNNFYEFLYSTG